MNAFLADLLSGTEKATVLIIDDNARLTVAQMDEFRACRSYDHLDAVRRQQAQEQTRWCSEASSLSLSSQTGTQSDSFLNRPHRALSPESSSTRRRQCPERLHPNAKWDTAVTQSMSDLSSPGDTRSNMVRVDSIQLLLNSLPHHNRRRPSLPYPPSDVLTTTATSNRMSTPSRSTVSSPKNSSVPSISSSSPKSKRFIGGASPNSKQSRVGRSCASPQYGLRKRSNLTTSTTTKNSKNMSLQTALGSLAPGNTTTTTTTTATTTTITTTSRSTSLGSPSFHPPQSTRKRTTSSVLMVGMDRTNEVTTFKGHPPESQTRWVHTSSSRFNACRLPESLRCFSLPGASSSSSCLPQGESNHDDGDGDNRVEEDTDDVIHLITLVQPLVFHVSSSRCVYPIEP